MIANEDIAALIKKCNRPQDESAFAVDVVEVFPDVAESYKKVCPKRLNLKEMEEKANQGKYAGVDWHKDVIADIQLIVNNCLRFNGEQHPLSQNAMTLEKHAQSLINDVLLKPKAHRGTAKTTGAATQTGVKRPLVGQAQPMAPVATKAPAASSGRLSLKQPTKKTLKPSEHHVPFKIPTPLKVYIVNEYTKRLTLTSCELPPKNNVTVSVVLTSFLTAASSEPTYPVNVATAVVEAICDTFDKAFMKSLLYDGERVAVNRFLLKAYGDDATSELKVTWHMYAEPKFLLRFLVHFPQIGSLVAQSTSPVGGELLVERVIPVLEDLLLHMGNNAELLGLSPAEGVKADVEE